MKIVDMTATADDNLLEEEQKDLEYRKAQLQKLKEEVVDIEDRIIYTLEEEEDEFEIEVVNNDSKNRYSFKETVNKSTAAYPNSGQV